MTMNEIVPRLWLGDASDSIQSSAPKNIICLMHEAMPQNPRGIWMPLFRNDISARRSQLDATARLIDSYLKEGESVLVHCAGGIDRAPLIVAWYLHRFQNMTLDEAYKIVKEKRPQINLHPDWVIDV